MIRSSFPVLIESMAREMGLTEAQKAMLLFAWFPCVSLSPDAIQRYRCDLSSVRPLVVFTSLYAIAAGICAVESRPLG